MATPSTIKLSTTHHPQFQVSSLSEESAQKASELLQENHDSFHIFFNKSGFHNHIAHHILTIYALGASPATLQRHYDANKTYQRPPAKLDERIVREMHDPDTFDKYKGIEKYYNDYLIFFQKEMEEKGWENVLNEYVFKGDEKADDMLVRMFSGFLHPIIHLGFGIEFAQPAIIAEALAQAACHSNWIGSLYLGAEKAAKSQTAPSKTIVQLLEEIKADTKLTNSAHWDDGNKIQDGVLVRARDEMIKYASQYHIDPSSSLDSLDEKTAEMINAVTYYTGGAQRPPKQVKFDFYFMHCVNSSIFFPAFLKQEWLSKENKIRLLEWKVRTDLAMFASRRSPDILLDEITGYTPKQRGSWESVYQRVRDLDDDDGHAAKLVRAVANGKSVSAKYESGEGYMIKGDMWDKLGHMVIDSVEDTGNHWARSVGFDEAWENFVDRPKAVAAL